VVWFEEPLPAREFDQAIEVCRDADLVVVVGTSGIVQPAASLPHLAGANGIPIVEVDPRETLLTEAATVSLRATAAGAIPAMVRAAALE
jgi:NAD-dependent deacetylase